MRPPPAALRKSGITPEIRAGNPDRGTGALPGATVKVPPKEYPLGQRAGPAMTPVPLRLIDCGDPGALSTIFSAALRVPAAVAVKPILITHEAFDSTDAGQVLVWVKSPGFAPPI